MATQPTQNQVPSESPRDLKFNAGKIDEFVTSLVNTYIDRFGTEHYTIEGIRWLAQQAIAQYGWIPFGTFQAGATLTLPNQILKDTTDGEYYRWDGTFLPDGKNVPAGSTPASSGGTGMGAWLSVGDSTVRTWAIKTFYSTGLKVNSAGVGLTIPSGTDAVFISGNIYPLSVPVAGNVTEINLTIKPYHIIAGGVKSHPLDITWFRKGEIHARSYWAVGDGVTSDSDCIQAMIDDIPYVSETQTAANVYFDKPDVAYRLTKPVWVYEKDHTVFKGEGIGITKFLVDDLLDIIMPSDFSSINGVNGHYYDVQAAFQVAARRRTQSQSQGYISANQAAWGLVFEGMSINITGDAKQVVKAFNVPQFGKARFEDIRIWGAKEGIYSDDFYLVNIENVDFNECYRPWDLKLGTSVVANKVSSSNCAFGYRTISNYYVLNSVTNDHWGKDKNGSLMTDSYAYEGAGLGGVMNGCGCEYGYGGIFKFGYKADGSTIPANSLTINGGMFMGGTKYTEQNYTGQTGIADFGVSTYGFCHFNNTKVTLNDFSLRNTIESSSSIVAKFPINLRTNSRIIVGHFCGLEGSVNSNIARWVSIIDFDLDSSSLVVSSDQAEKPGVRANLSANYTPAASSTVTLVMDTEVYDNLGNYNNSNGIFIVPVTGWYRIDVSLAFSGAGINYASITGLDNDYTLFQSGTASTGVISFSLRAKATKGNNIRLNVQTTSSSAASIYRGSGICIEML